MESLSLKECVFQNKQGLAIDEESVDDIEMDSGLLHNCFEKSFCIASRADVSPPISRCFRVTQ